LIVDLNGLQLDADHVMPAVEDDAPPLGKYYMLTNLLTVKPDTQLLNRYQIFISILLADLPVENVQQNIEGHHIRQGGLNIDLNGPPPADDE
uniref:Uncharacterized protein n=1 Tax=Meloidogyne javanica TaxID=6303 RepID=A0A915LNN2_MELJA